VKKKEDLNKETFLSKTFFFSKKPKRKYLHARKKERKV
jgi:hypothetical protein